jgi:hypothetical protein
VERRKPAGIGRTQQRIVGVGVIQIAPQMCMPVAIEAVGGSKYAPSIDMRSLFKTRILKLKICLVGTVAFACRAPHHVAF